MVHRSVKELIGGDKTIGVVHLAERALGGGTDVRPNDFLGFPIFTPSLVCGSIDTIGVNTGTHGPDSVLECRVGGDRGQDQREREHTHVD
jgi:hypothetical protein